METALLQNIYGKERLDSISLAELEKMSGDFPWFALGQLFLVRRTFEEGKKGTATAPALQKVWLYMDNPLLLHRFLTWKEPSPAEKTVQEDLPETSNQPETVLPPGELFQPLFSRDYFASQGIRLTDTLINDTKRPTMAELRSFTDWLKTTRRSGQSPAATSLPGMKRAPGEEGDEDPALTEAVERMATHSLDNREEIVTEAMAEVWNRQGQPGKAVHIYEKLGLLNPGKSSYFAGKISEIKQSNS